MTSLARASGRSPVGVAPIPSPISWPPSESWDGDDGKWSSFALRIGKPEQTVRVLISTASVDTYVVTPAGCPPNAPGTSDHLSCSQSRGGLFVPSHSSSWSEIGNYSLGTEVNLGYDAAATYGLDTITLGSSNFTGGPTLNSQVVAGLVTYNFYTGIFGLGKEPTNFTASSPTNITDVKRFPSFLASLKASNLIPSLSWAYTAGAPYRLNEVFGSLTFGGSDLARYVPNNVSFSLSPDSSRDILVNLNSISLTDATRVAVPLLPNAILTFIDSTLPFIYLPLEACQAFEAELGLIYDSTTRLYSVNDTLHESLIANNPTFTFSLADQSGGHPTVDIVLPYASFDFDVASYPRVRNTTRFFPLKRSSNETQYTLGRAFLQEAYLVTNYEHSTFSVYQANFEGDLSKQIVAIPSANATTSLANVNAEASHSTRIRRRTVVGASIGAATSFLILISILVITIWKRRSKASRQNKSTSLGSLKLPNGIGNFSTIYEIDNNSLYWGRPEIPDTGKAELLDKNCPSGSGRNIQEMPPHSPAELMSSQCSLGISTAKNQKSLNRIATFISKGRSKEDRTSSDKSEGFPRIELPMLSSLGRPSSQRRSSHHTSRKPERISPDPLRCRPLDLNRSLPTTPISESPQVSPYATSFSSQFTVGDYLYTQPNRSADALSTPVYIECLPKPLVVKRRKVHGRHKRSLSSDPLMKLDIVVPLGISRSQTL